jgi:hypothetical protein
MAQSGLGAIYRVVYPDKANPDVHPSGSSQSKSPEETSRAEAQPDAPARLQPGADAQCDPGDTKCRGGLPVDAAAPQAIPDRDDGARGSPLPEHDGEASRALNTDSSGTVPPGISDREDVGPSSSPPEQDDQPSRALNTDPSGALPPGISDRDVPAPSSSPPAQDDQPSHALNADPSETVLPNSTPNIESDAPAPVAPETAKKKHPAKKVKPRSSPSE